MDEKTRSLKVVPPSKKEVEQVSPNLDPLDRFKGMVLNLTESAYDCLNRISQREMQKDSPSPTLMEEYFLLHHYLDFIERLCRDKKDSSSQTLLEEYLLLHESMHFE
jgi:hypothetical protein